MPIIANYLIKQYFKVFLLSLIAFIAILLTTRFDEIAHFASLGGHGEHLFLFIVYQLPYILPIAMPIAALISIVILLQRLSHWHELTALRAAGMSLKTILSPLLLSALFLSFLNFIIVSEFATSSHLNANLLKTQLRAINPLLLLHNKHLMQLKGIYFDALGPSRLGEWAEDVIISMPERKHERLHLAITKKMLSDSSSGSLEGSQITFITSLNANNSKEKENESSQPDHLIVENIQKMKSENSNLTPMLKKKVWSLNNDHLTFSLLLSRRKEIAEKYTTLNNATLTENSNNEIKSIKNDLNRIDSDILRRFSVSLSVFTFTLMGAAFGINIGRTPKKSGLATIICFAVIYLIAFFTAKGAEHLTHISAALYFIPHIVICISSFRMLHRINCGIE